MFSAMELSGMIWIEQTAPGQFTRHTLEPLAVDHPSLAVGDHDGDGDVDVAAGHFTMQLDELDDDLPYSVTIWENQAR